MDDLDPTRFAVHRAEVRDGVELAFVHERPSTGGFPLVVLHGWPETKRIWWGWSSRSSMRARSSEPPRFFERSSVPTLALYGPEDHVIWPDFPERCEVVFEDLVGPLVVPRAGHFLPWERAELFARATIAYLRDLLPGT